MKSDWHRLLAIGLLALAVGIAIDAVLASLLVAALAHLAWLYLELNQMLRWLRKPKKTEAPDRPGIFEELCREIDRLRGRHKKRKRKLSGYLKQFRQATAALPDATIALGADDEILWANQAAERYLGIRWPADYQQRLQNLLRDPRLFELLAGAPFHDAIEIASPIEGDRHLSIRIAPYGDKQRLLVARDVTRLHRMNQTRRDFVANVSHELRTPLTVLTGYLQALSEDVDTPAEMADIIKNMRENSERMQRLIEDLLQLSKLEEETPMAYSEVVPVAELIADVHKEARRCWEAERQIFYLDVDSELWILGSAQELYSAISNLVVNAVKYTPPQGIIRVRWYRDEDGAHFEVQDTGQGIPPNQISRVTERFYRVDPSRSRSSGGTGLGLAIVKHVLQRHDASLHIESELGKGSTFRCDFPVTVIVDTLEEESA